MDAQGNGSAIIRFLPAPEDEDIPFVRYWNHGFQGPSGKWYIENSLSTLGQKDPCGEYNSRLWRESDNDDSPQRKQARKQKRKEHFVSNILVIKDTGNPENNGKVLLYRYGKKIFNMLSELTNPVDDGIGETIPIDPFNMWNGADFYLRQRKVEGYPNYDKSSFGAPKAISDDDDYLETLLKSTHSLKAVIDPSNFKTYEQLQKRLNMVLELDGPTRNTYEPDPIARAPEPRSIKTDLDEDDIPWDQFGTKASSVKNDEEDDSDLSFFRRLAEED